MTADRGLEKGHDHRGRGRAHTAPVEAETRAGDLMLDLLSNVSGCQSRQKEGIGAGVDQEVKVAAGAGAGTGAVTEAPVVVAMIHAVAPGLAHGVDTGLDPDQGQQVVQASDRGVQGTVPVVEVALSPLLDLEEDNINNHLIMLLHRLPVFPRGCRLAHHSTRASSCRRRHHRTTNQSVISIRCRLPSAFLLLPLLSQDSLTNFPASQSHPLLPLRKTTKDNGHLRRPARHINTLSILNIQLLRRTLPRRRRPTSSHPVARWLYLLTLPHSLLRAVLGRLRRRRTRINLPIMLSINSISSINPSIISLSSTTVVTIRVIPSTSRATISNTKDVKETTEEEADQVTEVDVEAEELDGEITVEGGMEGSVVVPRGVVVGRD